LATHIRLLWLTIMFSSGARARMVSANATKSPSDRQAHRVVDLAQICVVSRGRASDKMIAAINAAFKDKHTRKSSRINSPGAPRSVGYINDEIRRLLAKYPEHPVHVVVQDLCASGGYYVASPRPDQRRQASLWAPSA